jgi:DNA-binding GntR family transcriptional regulator
MPQPMYQQIADLRKQIESGVLSYRDWIPRYETNSAI